MLSQTKRAISARESRVKGREKRRFNAILNDYVHTKYNNVYSEAREMYKSLNEKYPAKHNLTKTKEWKLWKRNMRTTEETSDEEQATTTTVDEEQTTTTAVDKEQTTTTAVDEEQTTTAADEEQTTTTAVDEEQTTTAVDEEQTTTAADEEQTTTAAEPATNGNENRNVLEIAMDEPMDEPIPENVMELDNIINGIMQELQQDEDLLNILNNDDYVQAHYADEDEGIGLNVEIELEDIVEPLDLEAEGFFDFF